MDKGEKGTTLSQLIQLGGQKVSPVLVKSWRDLLPTQLQVARFMTDDIAIIHYIYSMFRSLQGWGGYLRFGEVFMHM
jgi:hypothetical protein